MDLKKIDQAELEFGNELSPALESLTSLIREVKKSKENQFMNSSEGLEVALQNVEVGRRLISDAVETLRWFRAQLPGDWEECLDSME